MWSDAYFNNVFTQVDINLNGTIEKGEMYIFVKQMMEGNKLGM
jgi:hypothetical protein